MLLYETYMSSAYYNYSNDFTSKSQEKSKSMKLENSNIVKFKVAKEFSENKARINSIDFSGDGKNLISSSDDDTIVLYDCERGVKRRDIMSKKYGVDLIRYTHAKNNAIHTSTKENDTIRYLSLHDNKYLKYFCGHEKRVISLSMCPSDDTFLSASLDNTVKLWNLKEDKFLGTLTAPSPPTGVNYDPEGLIFAVGIKSDLILLYDVRNYHRGPFNTIKFSGKNPPHLVWESLKFSPNGKQILITTNTGELFVNDAFSGQPLYKMVVGIKSNTPIDHPCEACYTPDSQYILCGGLDGCVYAYESAKGGIVSVLRNERANAEPVQCVKFNPTYMLMASACSKMAFWIPTVEEEEPDALTANPWQ